MIRHTPALFAALLLVSMAGAAQAEPVAYDDDYERSYERGDAMLAAASAVAFRVPSASGSLEQFGTGGGLSLAWLDVGGEFPTGLEADAIFVTGEDGGRFYDLGLSIIGSGRVGANIAVPFASVGLDLSGVSLPTSSGGNEGGMALGVHGNVGLHGFVTPDVYWRGQIGYLGAAIGGVKAQISVGWVFGRD